MDMLISLSPMNGIFLRISHDSRTTPERCSYSIKLYRGWIVHTIAECAVFPEYVRGVFKSCNDSSMGQLALSCCVESGLSATKKSFACVCFFSFSI